MKRLWAAFVVVAMLVGCRGSQQPSNPFLRTAVPPPGTGQAAVVTPGTPYYPGPTPGVPEVTPGALSPPVAPVGPVTPVAPLTPGPPPPGTLPPGAVPQAANPLPPAPPKKDKYGPPGGSYIFNQF